jgi:hypothetical protein
MSWREGERGRTGDHGQSGSDGRDGRPGAPGAQGPPGPDAYLSRTRTLVLFGFVILAFLLLAWRVEHVASDLDDLSRWVACTNSGSRTCGVPPR